MEQYDKVCKDRFTKIETQTEKIEDAVNEIKSIVTNGLRDKVKENNDRIKGLDNRLWLLMTGVFLSVALQIMFHVI